MLEATLALSKLEHTDRQQRTAKLPSSQPGAQGSRHSQTQPVARGHTSPNSVPLPLAGSYAKVVVAGSHAQILGSMITPHKVAYCSANSQESKHEKPKDDVTTEEGHTDQSEKPKRSRNRRRRKGCGQQVVGLSLNPSAPPPVLLWFRRDLRLCDNPALIGSLEVGAPVIPVFIWSPEEEEGPGVTIAMGGACKYNWQLSTSCLCFLSLRCRCMYILCLSSFQLNSGSTRRWSVSVPLWRTSAAILSSGRRQERARL